MRPFVRGLNFLVLLTSALYSSIHTLMAASYNARCWPKPLGQCVFQCHDLKDFDMQTEVVGELNHYRCDY